MSSGVGIPDTTIVTAADTRPVGTQLTWLNLHPSFESVKRACLPSRSSRSFCRFVANGCINVKKIQFAIESQAVESLVIALYLKKAPGWGMARKCISI